jgi:hypothetical protein
VPRGGTALGSQTSTRPVPHLQYQAPRLGGTPVVVAMGAVYPLLLPNTAMDPAAPVMVSDGRLMPPLGDPAIVLPLLAHSYAGESPGT